MPLTNSVTLILQVGEALLGLEAARVAEVLHLCELSRPPGLPGFLAGFLNLEGRAMPALQLDRVLGLPPREPDLYSHLVLLHSGVALVAGRVLRLAEIPPEQHLALAPGCTFNDCCRAELPLPEGTVHLLDVDRLLLREEKERLAELTSRAQERLAELEAG